MPDPNRIIPVHAGGEDAERLASWLEIVLATRDRIKPTPQEIARWSTTRETPWGRLGYLAPVAQMSRTPAEWALPSVPPGTDPPRWA